MTIGDETQVFDRPRGKDLDIQQIVDLRKMLNATGITLESLHEKVVDYAATDGDSPQSEAIASRTSSRRATRALKSDPAGVIGVADDDVHRAGVRTEAPASQYVARASNPDRNNAAVRRRGGLERTQVEHTNATPGTDRTLREDGKCCPSFTAPTSCSTDAALRSARPRSTKRHPKLFAIRPRNGWRSISTLVTKTSGSGTVTYNTRPSMKLAWFAATMNASDDVGSEPSRNNESAEGPAETARQTSRHLSARSEREWQDSQNPDAQRERAQEEPRVNEVRPLRAERSASLPVPNPWRSLDLAAVAGGAALLASIDGLVRATTLGCAHREGPRRSPKGDGTDWRPLRGPFEPRPANREVSSR